MKKRFIVCCTIALVSLNAMSAWASTPVNGGYTEANTSDIVERKDDIRYQYKVVDNVLYRRLYNYSRNEPVTDWEILP
ncbi:hypothetical protein [Otoolea muris]|uniref:hypothetical protein n=1 Tax=Otoolea muris TaxID=2941515 RepID=UPI00203F1BBE|nr:hypothetical protein [Otoolea muris]